MIPHRPHGPAISAVHTTEHSERFFLVEKPGLDVAVMAGIEEELIGNEGGTEDVTAL